MGVGGVAADPSARRNKEGQTHQDYVTQKNKLPKARSAAAAARMRFVNMLVTNNNNNDDNKKKGMASVETVQKE